MKQKWLKSAAAGLIGFVITYLAAALALIVELQAFSPVGGRSLSLLSELTLYVLAPLLLITGPALTSRIIGARVRHSAIIGLAAAATAILVYLVPDAPVDWLETAAFVAAAVVTVTLAAASREFKWPTVIFSGLLGLGLLLVAALTTGLGFVISLVAWLILPVVSTSIQ